MSRVTYFVAATIDGFIADPDDSLAWLLRQDIADDGPNAYGPFIAGVGALVMGSTTYEWLLREGPWPYEIPSWVMTSRELAAPTDTASGAPADVRFSSDPIPQVHAAMRDAAGEQDLWVVGGGDLAGQFADAGLLDEILLSIAPVTLGGGRQVLPRRLDLELVEHGRNGAFLTARYLVRGPLAD
ncbi:dihydrofolate reductase family protein [Leucobacter luti]|uniref:Dihydrofolate reductase n=1 Tax=Leucobacter luti TaxID=340320 RepID=A0A4Q7TVF4_9MICO|nr:dihydrofolate reductase family protein [Leucobacter luti]MBL3698194.1 dihydrofolate reductase [Leucobacter luti]RZT64723.1 dihydrofolate reductase [Leucobacter luti]